MDPALDCTWRGCDQRQAWQENSIYGDGPLCVAHFYEVWRQARNLADRQQNRASTVEVKLDGRFQRVEVPVSDQGWIYYLRNDNIKIGFTTDLARRMKAYTPSTEFLFAHPGTKTDEKVAHSLLTVHRVARREWYADCPEVRAFIDQAVARHTTGQHYGPGSFFAEPSDPVTIRPRRRTSEAVKRIA